jgi:hypothetical protein
MIPVIYVSGGEGEAKQRRCLPSALQSPGHLCRKVRAEYGNNKRVCINGHGKMGWLVDFLMIYMDNCGYHPSPTL